MAEVKEEKKEEGRIGSLFNLMDRFTGDKVILLIALFLMLVSVVSVFSSTPLLARELGTGRMDIMLDQLKAVAMGFIFIFLLYFFGRVEIYRRLSMLGFAVTFGILIILVLNLNLGIVKAGSINGARRILVVAGKQIHVYEFVKVFMIMYLGWALDTFKRHGFTFLPWLAWKYPKRLGFLEKDFYQKLFYIYLPILLTTFMVMMGSNSSALFIGLIMVLMILVGGIDGKDIGIMVLALAVGVGSMFLAWKAGLLKDSRIGTAISRITQDDDAVMQKLLDAPRGSKDFNDARDELKQPVSALLAIKEGGIFGKGIGNSTQKYATPVIFGDYMFSFIIEESGIIGAILIILLYFSLLARGTLVAKECDKYYDKMIVTGLIILVTGQAFMHMAVNVHLPFVPQTGQTLPLVSHGTNSLLVFSIVFGILLSISKDAKENIARREAEAEAEQIIVHDDDEWTQSASV
ncbi:MAG: FtsW/RodA/SpoVE family cell cycle protein [Bacteroidales bacterium]|nr:FtsW/RodA/SpoVE family cell cycle protein [Bacteroidales bacterium]